ncbi:uncharacterized protein B0H18DRAFT_493587 [Fomitopsis serialis]|uniref:uncharacterized protein n=1 Tax=Fomitopsis serialis TaxID=139415 RepID=UPI002008B621|nr:uncharacterized protein B0H18DRAFT_493587 [Neoantrodia serialis]KAH9934947.1 hypothetical protein B0H18DRAFT_493587 [Neoantrodia serialis]
MGPSGVYHQISGSIRARTVRKVFIETAAEYTRSRGLAVRAREHDYDIIRYTHPKGGRAIPVVFMCKQNITGADGLQPSEHAAVYTPSTVLQKVVALGDFHLIIRSGTQSKAGPREQVRYLGLYEVHDPKSPLLPDRFTSLDETVSAPRNSSLCQVLIAVQDQIHMQRFLRARQPHGTELNDKDIKKLPEAGELQLMVLQCKQFNKEFYTQLLQADAVTPVPVEGPMRTHPNWKKVRAQMLRLIEQSAIGGDDNSDA